MGCHWRGFYIPIKLVNGELVPKTKQECDEHDRRKIQLNAEDIYFSYYVIDRNEYSRVCQCKSTKEIWILLEVTHERTNPVKE